MSWIVIGGGFLALLAIHAAMVRSFGGIKPLNAPTPEDARIKLKADDVSSKAVADAEKEKQEVANASGAQLYDLARKRLRNGQ